MIVPNKFEFGDIVYLITDTEQKPRMVCTIELYKNGEIMYRLISGTVASTHYEYEISKEENVLMKTT